MKLQKLTEATCQVLLERIKSKLTEFGLDPNRASIRIDDEDTWDIALLIEAKGMRIKQVDPKVTKMLVRDFNVKEADLCFFGRNLDNMYEWSFINPDIPAANLGCRRDKNRAMALRYGGRPELPTPLNTVPASNHAFMVMKKVYYRMIESGEKTREYRTLNQYYCDKLFGTGKPVSTVCLQLGYSNPLGGRPEQMTWEVKDILLARDDEDRTFPTIKDGRFVTIEELPDDFNPDLYAIVLGRRIR